ncbi:MAG: hypothetical protein Q8P33_02515, partial [bacterium]|nr:hypothetical protein [bacterium]
DRIALWVESKDELVKKALESFGQQLSDETLATRLDTGSPTSATDKSVEFRLDQLTARVSLKRA